MRRLPSCTWLCLLVAWAVLPAARAQTPDRKDAEARPYLYEGADREQRLVARAKQEGTVAIYTSTQQPDFQPLVQAFEKKYGIRTTVWRASGEKIVQRMVTEARAGRYDADVAETDGSQMEILYREKLLAPFYTPALKDIPASIVPPHRHYVPTRITLYVLAYNTKLVAPGEVPNSYDDLLLPKWSGKIGIEADDVQWFGALVKAMGEKKGLAYFQKLAENRPSLRKGHTLLSELVAAGELAMAPDAHIQGAERLKKRGAPIDWKPLQPALGQPSSVGLTQRAPHPHAALLFADFLLSQEGQEIVKSRNRVPTNRAVASELGRYEYRLVDPVIVLDEWERWEKPWSELFLRGQRPRRDAE